MKLLVCSQGYETDGIVFSTVKSDHWNSPVYDDHLWKKTSLHGSFRQDNVKILEKMESDIFFRWRFKIRSPLYVLLEVRVPYVINLYINGVSLDLDKSFFFSPVFSVKFDVTNNLIEGDNIISFSVSNDVLSKLYVFEVFVPEVSIHDLNG